MFKLVIRGMVITAVAAVFLSACGGGGSSSGPTNAAPVFTSAAVATAEENQLDTGYLSVASDADGDPVSYSLGGVDAALFGIDAASGSISFLNAPDFETPLDDDGDNVYQVEVTASDGNGGNSVLSVSISVTDVGQILSVQFSFPTQNANLGGRVTQSIVTGNIVDLEGGTVLAADIGSLTVSGLNATFDIVNPARWSVTVPVQPGPNDLAVVFTDGSSNVLNSTISVDNQAIMGQPRGVSLDSTNNRLLVADIDMQALLAVDLTTGIRTVISSGQIGSGTAFEEPSDVELDSINNRALVIDRQFKILFAVDLATGDRTLFSGGGAGSGVTFGFPEYLELDTANNRIFVSDQSSGAVFAVDLTSGARSAVVGTGPVLGIPSGLELDAVNNRILLVDRGLDALIAVDLANGNRSILSNDSTGTGDNFDTPEDLVIDNANNRALVTDHLKLFAVDLTTGNRTVLDEVSVSGTITNFLTGIELDASNDRVLAVDRGVGRIASFELVSGSRSTVSDSAVGTGDPLGSIQATIYDSSENRLLTLTSGFDRLISIDSETGVRKLLSSDTAGGTNFGTPTDLVLDTTANRVLAVDTTFSLLGAIDLTTGVRSTVSHASTGSGVNLGSPVGVELDSAANRALIIDSLNSVRALIAVDLATGNRSVISNDATGSGPAFSQNPADIATDLSANRVLVSELATLLAVDLTTGDRSIISDAANGTGTDFDRLRGIALDTANNQLIAANVKLVGSGEPSVFTVNLSTGDRSVLSDNSNSGPVLFFPNHVMLDRAHNRIFVSDLQTDQIIVIDLSTGQRAVSSK